MEREREVVRERGTEKNEREEGKQREGKVDSGREGGDCRVMDRERER